jgi:ketosteroid isomerase-like protein
MTRTIVPLLAILALAGAPLPALRAQTETVGGQRVPRSDSTLEDRTLVKLENDWAQAVIRRDAKKIRSLVDPRWVYTDESGTMTREQGITAFTTGTDTVQVAGNDDMHIILHGSTVAVVTGVLWMRGRGPNGAFEHRYRYTDTWLRVRGVWRCIASQDLLLQAPGAGR